MRAGLYEKLVALKDSANDATSAYANHLKDIEREREVIISALCFDGHYSVMCEIGRVCGLDERAAAKVIAEAMLRGLVRRNWE